MGHVVDSIKFNNKQSSLTVETLDTGLTSVGSLNPEPYTPFVPDPSRGSYVSLVNNIWNTNYPQWFPFDGVNDPDSNIQYRFSIALSAAEAIACVRGVRIDDASGNTV